jgi:acyl-CoA thioesterase-2
MRVTADLGEDQLLHRCWMAYMSDDMPADAVRNANPEFKDTHGITFVASLDHTIWFHRPLRADRWHLYDVTCHTYVGARGLSVGHVFALDGTHVATMAQEVLVRDARQKPD